MEREERRYRIGQVAALLGVRPSTLRFWETVFPEARPRRTPSGQRAYTEEAVALLARIKRLVHDEGLTLEGARRRLDGEDAAGEHVLLKTVRRELEAVLRLLRDGPMAGPRP